MQGIYRILNLINNKWYVGSAKDIGGRWNEHKRDLRKGCDSKNLQRAFDERGAENFILEILKEVKGDRAVAFDQEQEYLDEWFPIGCLYNVSSKALGTQLIGESNPMYGKTHTDGTRAKMREAWTEERREEYSKKQSGENSPLYGKHRTEESKRKQSERMSGKNNPMYGKKRPEEFRARMSEITKKSWTPERREEQSKRFSGENNPNYGKVGYWSGKGGPNAQFYPAFYNVKTGGFIPAGVNLSKFCRELGVKSGPMAALVRGHTKQSRGGWCLASKKKVVPTPGTAPKEE